MDRELQEKLEKYADGFANILQENYLEDKDSKKGKCKVGEKTELTDFGDEEDYVISKVRICLKNYAYEDLYFNAAARKEAEAMQRDLIKLCSGKLTILREDGCDLLISSKRRH